MKLRYLNIQNFRGTGSREAPFEIDFTDDFGRVRDVIVIVGPNGTGKTSILDAIWFGLMGVIGNQRLQRENFRTEPDFVVSAGEAYAKVEYEIEISPEEQTLINEWRTTLHERGAINNRHSIDKRIAKILWTYPVQPGYEETRFGYGGYLYEKDNRYDWALLRGREYKFRLREIDATTRTNLDDVGEVYFFEQERRIITRLFRDIEPKTENGSAEDDNLRRILINLGLRELARQQSGGENWYKVIRDGFNYICAPHQMGEVYTSDAFGEFQIRFVDAHNVPYTIDGLSSGERAVLDFLTQYVYRRMKNSIVLIDEPEIHLHPTWQRWLIQYLRQLQSGNQFIIATHSPTVMQTVDAEEIIQLGHLDQEIPGWQYSPLDKETKWTG